MLLRLIFLFTLVPLIELYLLFRIANWTTPQFTITLVIATGILGAFLARKQGMQWREGMARQLQRGELPTDGLLDGLMIFVAGALLVTPGVLTDVVGFGLLVPKLRSWGKIRIRKKIAKSLGLPEENGSGWPQNKNTESSNRDVVIESYVIENSRTETMENSREETKKES